MDIICYYVCVSICTTAAMDHLRTGAIFRPSNSEFLKSPVPRLTNIRGVGSAFVGPDSRTTAPPLSSPEDSGTEGQRFVNSSVADRGSPVGRDQVIARPIPSRLFPTPPPRRQRDPSSSSVSSTFSHTLRTQQHACQYYVLSVLVVFADVAFLFY